MSEPKMPSFQQALAAEALGTAFLLLAVVGSGIMAFKLADGNLALALLANAIATGAALVVLIQIFGPISGAHLNPAVSLAFHLDGSLSQRDLLAYSGVQIVGGCVGVWLAHLMFELPLFQLSTTIRTGIGQWVAEIIAAFGLVLTILLTLRAWPDFVAAAVGLYITSAYWFTASTSFANPAVTIARALTDTFTGIRPLDAAPFVAAQCIGAALAWWVATQLKPQTQT